MAGHMGSKFRTILNLEIIKSDIENDLIYLKGSIPGSKNTVVFLRKSIKSINRKTTQDKGKKKMIKAIKEKDKGRILKNKLKKRKKKQKQKTRKKEIK